MLAVKCSVGAWTGAWRGLERDSGAERRLERDSGVERSTSKVLLSADRSVFLPSHSSDYNIKNYTINNTLFPFKLAVPSLH